MRRLPAAGLLAGALAGAWGFIGLQPPPAALAAEPGAPEGPDAADRLAEEATRRWDAGEQDAATRLFRESLALHPSAETYRALGWLLAERERHGEAVEAFRAAVALDPSLEPGLRYEIGQELLWDDRPAEAIPLLSSVHASRPADVEAARRLALALRWDDRLAESENLCREILRGNPEDAEARKGLAWSLLWQDRHREAAREFGRALGADGRDAEALVGLSRARLFLDLPEEADALDRRALEAAPRDGDALEQAERIRRRLERNATVELRASRDTDELAWTFVDLTVYGRAARGLDVWGNARQSFFRQGLPGSARNVDGEDAADGREGSLSAAWRAGPSISLRGGLGGARFDAGGFHPWTGHAGITVEPGDLLAFSADWERSHFDTILSFQNRVTADSLTLGVRRNALWRAQVLAEGGPVVHRNANGTGQPRENRGARAALSASRPLWHKGDDDHLTGIVRLGWLSFRSDLDVGVFDPERYTTEEAGADWRRTVLPRWVLFGTALLGAQQEKGNSGGPTYDVLLGTDRRVGRGVVTLAGFATDSRAAGPGGGYRRAGGLLRIRVPF